MLNEIFKGMDNAAEMINENFEKLDVEYGENENGHWKKFSDGTLECWFESNEVLTATTRAAGTDIYFGNLRLEFPVPFVEPPVVAPTNRRISGIQWAGNRDIEADFVNVYLFSPASGSEGKVGYRAIGRWKE